MCTPNAHDFDRRLFLRSGGMLLAALGLAPGFALRALAAGRNSAATARGRILVCVFQRGAVDGLNMIVPHGEAAYYTARPSIAIPRPRAGSDEAAIDLDGFFGLHPQMAPLAPWWRKGQLAVVQASGSPHATRSHFDAQDFMETATPGVRTTADGWLNRALGAPLPAGTRASAFAGMAITPAMPRALAGRAPALAVARLDDLGLRGNGDQLADRFAQIYGRSADTLLAEAGAEGFAAVDELRRALARVGSARAEYPRGPLADSLSEVSRLIKADVGLRIAFVETGGWDHHANEGGTQGQLANNLRAFAGALAAFAEDLGDRFADVVVVTMSEFGRTVRENGNRGTDHGHGNANLIFGGPVRGGRVYGRWPGLAAGQLYEGRDLAVTTDFRDVFGEVAERHLGIAEPAALFPAYALDPSRYSCFLA